MIPNESEFRSILKNLGRSENTIKAYTRDLSAFFKIYNEITHLGVQGMTLEMSSKGIQPSTVRRFVSSIKTYCSIFEIDINFATIALPKLIKREAAYITDEIFTNGIGTILAEESTSNAEQEFKSLLFNFLYKTGMRVTELLNLTKANYNQEEQHIQIIGKGNKQRKIPIHRSLIHAFDLNWFFSCLETTPYNTVLYWTKKYFGEEYSPHSFRHGYTTKLINKGVSHKAVQSVLGHGSYMTTQRYVHMNDVEIQNEVISALEEEND